MGFFEDKTYTDMDWLNRAIEPYEWPEFNKFHSIPNKIDIKMEDILEVIKAEYWTNPCKLTDNSGYYRAINGGGMEKHNFLSKLMPKYIEEYTNWRGLGICQEIETSFFLEQFKLEVSEIEIDLPTGNMTGSMSIVRNNITDVQTPAAIIEILSNKLYWQTSQLDKDQISRVKEIVDIIGIPDEERSALRSRNGTTNWLHSKLVKIIKENEWNIKQVALIFKMVTWIRAYIRHGNLAALTNFTKLKCMTHKQVAIYSMEEVS